MKRDLTESIENTLIESRAVNRLAGATQKLMNRVFGPPLKPIKILLNGTWLEHPLHPALTDIPIGGWTIGILLDLVALIFGVGNLGLASGIAIGLGILGALGAIASGFADWMDVDPPELAVGITHAVINIGATILFAISFIILWSNHWAIGWADFIPAVLGYLTIMGGAFLGGSLVFRQGVMVNRGAYRSGPDKFVPVLPMNKLPDYTPVRVSAEGRPVLLVRRGEEVHAIGAVCSHYGAPLEEGSLRDGSIECPWHGSRFCLANGKVTAGPATAPVPSYEVRINGDQIEVRAR